MNTQDDKNSESLNQYDKLLEKYTQLLDKNEKLEAFTKKKIFDNASFLRNVKDTHTQKLLKYKSIVQSLQLDVKNHIDLTNKINTELSALKKHTLKVEKINKELKSKIDVIQEYRIPFEVVLETQIGKAKRNNESLIFAVLGIDNFSSLQKEILTFTTIDNFTLGIYKFIQKHLSKHDTIYYYETGTYFIAILNKDTKSTKNILQNIGLKKVINNTTLTMSSCMTKMKEDDTTNNLLDRGLFAYNDFIKDFEISQVIEI